jgi:iron complex outermembrane receptor protein
MFRKSFKSFLVSGTAFAALSMALTGTAHAQRAADADVTQPAVTPTGAETPVATTAKPDTDIIVTGSRIKRDPNDSSLPLQIVTTEDFKREGINSPEQLISYLSTNGNGADNLASNSDIVSGAQRGTNGLSAANLRGQGSASTLVLLNGRRVAAHGLQGSAVDVNQIPFAAIDRVEVLKDGASAIYGTDAIGGVINFITKTNFQGVQVSGFTDVTQHGGGNIYRASATVGYGDLVSQGFNVMAAVSKSWNGILNGSDRDFVNGNQPNRGLSIDTRGTPIATAFPNGVNALFAPQGSLLFGVPLLEAGATVQANGGINILDLPGGAGCDSVDGGMAYDDQLWANSSARYACAWDTGRAATLQQPLETLTYYSRGTLALGEHQVFAEVTGSNADSSKRFSNNQYSGNATSLPLYYPRNALTAATYDDVFNRIRAVFPQVAANYGRPIAYRWRNIPGGQREYETNTKTFRAALGVDGPLFDGWDYRAGGSYARSEANSVLGTGYHYRGIFANAASAAASGVPGAVANGIDPRAPTAPGASAPGIVGLLNSGILNPFSLTQSDAALSGLDAISAEGVTLYGGKYEVKQFDASVSGKLFRLPGGMVQIALGGDYRRETYGFDGSTAAVLGQPDIFNVAFDNINALDSVSRTVKAVYAELLVPVFKPLEISLAGRFDDYTGFGTTFNPKVTAKLRPVDWLMLRGSYNTGFRVPSFNQIFNGTTQSANPGNTLVDYTTCPSRVVNATVPGCAPITPESLSGGNLALGPETSKQFSAGIVFQPSRKFSASVDFWSIAVDDVIGSLDIRQLLDNAAFFPDRILRTNGIITLLDLRTDNIGSRRTQGIELSLRGGVDALGGLVTAGMDGTYLVRKKEKLFPTAPYRDQIGIFTYAGDLGLRWKHNAFINFERGPLTLSVSQLYRSGYDNNALPGSLARPDYNRKVKSYLLHNVSAGYELTRNIKVTAGVRNILDKDPPFAITYDSNTGSGSSWEPRIADPRGRSFTLLVDAKF